MIKSMTGFGRSEITFNELYEIKLQIKSVNHRYADYSIKTPRSYSFIEEHIRTRLSSYIQRGKVEVSVLISMINDDSKEISLNRELARSYVEGLREASDLGLNDDLSLGTLASFQDIFDVKYKDVDEETVSEGVDKALGEALEAFITMRESEGARLKESLLGHLSKLLSYVETVEERSPVTVTEYRERLEKKLHDTLREIGVSADESRILTEVAIFADKVAVDEETVRLRSHIGEFEKTLEMDGPVGKKLDFIVQEMNRETNTIGSKCSDFELSKCVVNMKTIIEKIREQIQNIE